MTLPEFVAMVERDLPDELAVGFVSKVRPHPWVERRGSGSQARIRMEVGTIKYERRQTDEEWARVEDWSPWVGGDG